MDFDAIFDTRPKTEAPDEAEGGDTFEVERVVKKRVRNGTVEYVILFPLISFLSSNPCSSDTTSNGKDIRWTSVRGKRVKI